MGTCVLAGRRIESQPIEPSMILKIDTTFILSSLYVWIDEVQSFKCLNVFIFLNIFLDQLFVIS